MVTNFYKFIKSNLLTIAKIAGVIFGFAIGLIVRSNVDYKLNSREISYISFCGELFLRMLKALIIPLIISSLISAVGSLEINSVKKLGFRAIIYYLVTTILAVILGIVLVSLIKPGSGGINDGGEVEGYELGEDSQHDDNKSNNQRHPNLTTTDTILDLIRNELGEDSQHDDNKSNNQRHPNLTTTDTILDLIRNVFPANLVQAATHQYRTVLKYPEMSSQMNITDLNNWTISGEYISGTNILGLVVFSIVVGSAISSLSPTADGVLAIFSQINHISMKITQWVIAFSPIGVFFLICAKIIELDDLGNLGGKLGMYFVTVCLGILFHGFVILPVIYLILTRKNPYKYICNMGQALITAFGTASSSAALPVTIKDLEENNKINSKVVRFVIPIGATINMDGTALYEAVAAIFIAQMRDLQLQLADIIAISLTATAASIGAAGIPQAGLVTMVMVLDTVGLPIQDVSLIIAVDWLLDRIRTTINVLGDSIGAGILDHFYNEELKIKEDNLSLNVTNVAEQQL